MILGHAVAHEIGHLLLRTMTHSTTGLMCALWDREDLKRARGSRPAELDRVIVAVDPPASAHGDACGIVVAGRKDRRAFILADRTVRGLSPGGWAGAVCQAARDYGAHEVVAEGNQGGDMVRAVLRTNDCPAPVEMVHASRSKAARAEPVALPREGGRVSVCRHDAAFQGECDGFDPVAVRPGRARACAKSGGA